jgi:hypothetical protein
LGPAALEDVIQETLSSKTAESVLFGEQCNEADDKCVSLSQYFSEHELKQGISTITFRIQNRSNIYQDIQIDFPSGDDAFSSMQSASVFMDGQKIDLSSGAITRSIQPKSEISVTIVASEFLGSLLDTGLNIDRLLIFSQDGRKIQPTVDSISKYDPFRGILRILVRYSILALMCVLSTLMFIALLIASFFITRAPIRTKAAATSVGELADLFQLQMYIHKHNPEKWRAAIELAQADEAVLEDRPQQPDLDAQQA